MNPTLLDTYINRLPDSIKLALQPANVTAQRINAPPIGDVSELSSEYGRTTGNTYFNPRGISRAYDSVIDDSERNALRASQLAATSYNNRQVQRGIGVTGAGDALRAQLSIQGRQQTNALVKDKQTIIAEIRQRQAAQAAQLAAQLAQSRQQYSSLLVSTNTSNAANKLAADTFNTQNQQSSAQSLIDAAIKAAQLEAISSERSGAGGARSRVTSSNSNNINPSFYPGYITNPGFQIQGGVVNGVRNNNVAYVVY